MIRRTYGDVKTELARYAGVSGMPVTDARVLNYFNLSVEELMNEGDWPSLIDRYKFRVYCRNITLPGIYERVLNMTVNHVPQTMQSPWYELVGFGPVPAAEQFLNQQQLTDNAWDDLNRFGGVMDRMEVCTFQDIPDPAGGIFYQLSIATTADERVGGNFPDPIIIQGYDGNSQWIRSEDNSGNWIDGATFYWTQSGSIQTATATQDFSKITAVIKPETRMPVNLYMSPIGVPGQGQTQIARWEARETRPSYRRYHVPLLNANTGSGISSDPSQTPHVVVANIRRRFVAVENDNDELIITNLPALKAMFLALNYQEKNDMDNYAKHKAVAIEILQKEADKYLGPQRRKPLITFADGAGVRQNSIYVI